MAAIGEFLLEFPTYQLSTRSFCLSRPKLCRTNIMRKNFTNKYQFTLDLWWGIDYVWVMKLLAIIFWSFVLLMSSSFLLWGIIPPRRSRNPINGYVSFEEPPEHPPPDPKTKKLNQLIRALAQRNIKHNTKALASTIIKQNPDINDIETLVELSLKKLRDNFERNCL